MNEVPELRTLSAASQRQRSGRSGVEEEWQQGELQLEPVDWKQLRLLAKLTPGERMMAMARASAFSRALLRGAFRRRYPDLPIEEINMMMFRYIERQKERGL